MELDTKSWYENLEISSDIMRGHRNCVWTDNVNRNGICGLALAQGLTPPPLTTGLDTKIWNPKSAPNFITIIFYRTYVCQPFCPTLSPETSQIEFSISLFQFGTWTNRIGMNFMFMSFWSVFDSISFFCHLHSNRGPDPMNKDPVEVWRKPISHDFCVPFVAGLNWPHPKCR